MHIDSCLTPELQSNTLLTQERFFKRDYIHYDMLIQSLRHERSLEAYDIPYLSNNIYVYIYIY